jgi:small subunit ribosomal protein S6
VKEYELTVLIDPSLEAKIEQPLEIVRNLITTNGGKITKEENWGKKRLVYEIKKQSFAVYVYFEAELPASAPLKISNNLNISNEVIRYLLVATDLKAKKAMEEAKKAAESTQE